MYTIADVARLLNRPYMQVYRAAYRYRLIPAPTLLISNRRRPLYSQAQVEEIRRALATRGGQ